MAYSRGAAKDSDVKNVNNDVAKTVPVMDVGNASSDETDSTPLTTPLTNSVKAVHIEEDIQHTKDVKTENYKNVPVVMSRAELFADVYKMDYPRRGKAVIINIENFSSKLDCEARIGTNIDANNIERRLKLLGFEVVRKNDVTCGEIKSTFRKVAQEDHNECDCFVGVLLSHGEKDGIYGTDDHLELKEIFKFFKGNECKTLAGKPKIFFIQACRGADEDSGVSLNVADNKRPYDTAFPNDAPQGEIRIPSEADFLISYSTVPGYVAWRNQGEGSWFIQALVQVLDECGATSEIVKLLTKVNRTVAYDPRFWTHKKGNVMKQVPSFTSMLTKDLYFIPKTEEGSHWCRDRAADSKSEGGEVEPAKKKVKGVTDLVAQFERLQK